MTFEEAQKIVYGRMQVTCAWCKKDMGTKVVPREFDGKITHGICPECAAKMKEQAQMDAEEPDGNFYRTDQDEHCGDS